MIIGYTLRRCPNCKRGPEDMHLRTAAPYQVRCLCGFHGPEADSEGEAVRKWNETAESAVRDHASWGIFVKEDRMANQMETDAIVKAMEEFGFEHPENYAYHLFGRYDAPYGWYLFGVSPIEELTGSERFDDDLPEKFLVLGDVLDVLPDWGGLLTLSDLKRFAKKAGDGAAGIIAGWIDVAEAEMADDEEGERLDSPCDTGPRDVLEITQAMREHANINQVTATDDDDMYARFARYERKLANEIDDAYCRAMRKDAFKMHKDLMNLVED